jgi:4-hydroxy-3-polyprenylbenzoate decarboxylase
LPNELPSGFHLPDGFTQPRVALPGVLVVQGPRFSPDGSGVDHSNESLSTRMDVGHPINQFPLVVIVDDSEFTTRTLNNFLWVTFTRSNPADDIHGIGSFVDRKHWGCRGSLVIDARAKPHHAPPLEEDPDVTKRVDALAAPGGPLHGVI